MHRLLLVAVCLSLALGGFSQGKQLAYQAELDQLTDMEAGWVLVPIAKASNALDAGNVVAMQERLEAQAMERAFSVFGFSQVIFYALADSLELDKGLLDLNVWTATGSPPPNWPPPSDLVFLLEPKAAGYAITPDVLIENSIVQRREARADSLVAAANRRKARRADRIRYGLRTERDTWGHEKVVRMARRLRVLTEGRDTTAFQFTYSNFDPINRDAGGWVVHRYSPTVIRKHNDLQYTFDFHYFIKLHYQTPSEQRYGVAVGYLEERLKNRLEYLRNKY